MNLPCECKSKKHDKELGCIIQHDGFHGDFCDACQWQCHPQLQIRKYPRLKLNKCSHPEQSIMSWPKYETIKIKTEEDFDDIEEKPIQYARGKYLGRVYTCKRCKKEWVTQDNGEKIIDTRIDADEKAFNVSITDWEPDTCGCHLRYVWDTATSGEERIHTFFSESSICKGHPGIQGLERYEAALKQNQMKNLFLGRVVEMLPDIIEEVINEEGQKVKQLKKGIRYLFKFNGIDKNRQLVATFTGLKLSQSQKRLLQDYLDYTFGVGKGILVDTIEEKQTMEITRSQEQEPQIVLTSGKKKRKRAARR